jgi:hypothetical protein
MKIPHRRVNLSIFRFFHFLPYFSAINYLSTIVEQNIQKIIHLSSIIRKSLFSEQMNRRIGK